MQLHRAIIQQVPEHVASVQYLRRPLQAHRLHYVIVILATVYMYVYTGTVSQVSCRSRDVESWLKYTVQPANTDSWMVKKQSDAS